MQEVETKMAVYIRLLAERFKHIRSITEVKELDLLIRTEIHKAQSEDPSEGFYKLLDEKVLKAEKEVKRARAAVASAENEVDEQARKAMRLATQLDNHDIRGPGWNPLYAAAKRQHKLWDKCSSVVTAAEAVVQERLLLLKDAQMDSMLMEVEMGLVFFRASSACPCPQETQASMS